MRNSFFLIFTVYCSLFTAHSLAQHAGFTPVKNTQDFELALSKANTGLRTISSDFVQVKNMKMLSDKIKSTGKFLFAQPDKVRIEYTAPYYYLFVMNGNNITVKDEQKTTKIKTGNNKTMQAVNRVMIDCMKGTVMSNKDFKATVSENNRSYLLSMAPIAAGLKKMFSSIDIYLDKHSFDVTKLSFQEASGDFTDMEFKNSIRNIALDESMFKVK